MFVLLAALVAACAGQASGSVASSTSRPTTTTVPPTTTTLQASTTTAEAEPSLRSTTTTTDGPPGVYLAAFAWHKTIPFMNDIPVNGNLQYYRVYIEIMQPLVFMVEKAIRDGELETCSDLVDAYVAWQDSFLASAHKYEAGADWTEDVAGALWRGAMLYMGDGTFTQFVEDEC